ncbi:SDR family oxidoreductase [Candidatus Pacearchaeota archaeon]|jgi:NAD(P)-dependent dehydrogenase (short-subunit alcohol dehydrogenase family)|nr:SDR family oxidoreductase [Candidatus Pacearchaeota archaeon]
MNFDKLVALVTGGGSGIGYACVRALLRGGARVAMAGRNKEKLDAARKKLVENDAVPESSIMAVCADVTDASAVRSMFERVENAWGPVMALVNNAGVSGGRKLLSEITEEEWDRLMTANLRGLYLCTKAALPAMYANRWGRIVNISSVQAVSAKLMASAHYATTKGGIAAFTRRVAMEAAPQGVVMNCVAPGLIADTGFPDVKGELLQRYLALIPVNRPGTCEEVAELVAFLCSVHAGYIVGQTIVMDGGSSI